VNGYPSLCGCALLAPTPCASTPCASVTACNGKRRLSGSLVVVCVCRVCHVFVCVCARRVVLSLLRQAVAVQSSDKHTQVHGEVNPNPVT